MYKKYWWIAIVRERYTCTVIWVSGCFRLLLLHGYLNDPFEKLYLPYNVRLMSEFLFFLQGSCGFLKLIDFNVGRTKPLKVLHFVPWSLKLIHGWNDC